MTAPKEGGATKPKKSRSTHKKPSYSHFADGSAPDSPLSFTMYCREQLGTEMPVGSNRSTWFGQLKKEMDLHDWSYDDLVRAVAFIKVEGITVRFAYGVLHYVEESLKMAVRHQVSDLQSKVAKALGSETDEVWLRRLSLAQGTALSQVYENWRKERGGENL